ncbi:hypothetical protein F889_02185 [Acinetobacter colistiniresistens]|uniref:Phage tail protein C-terminal domain-containing protein n=1 Tax=Acinetobacter colistiniresistens TaxID=280145 RepID=N9PJ19_9GAMM|nr:hypothetical protein [Acinetobacter colistiniresistens]ENX33524.1 hypothetical protein F889_02185 [Acinetobacter colistiniresistens]
MTLQSINLGTAPTGAGGDTFRSTGSKVNENFTNQTHAASRYVGTAANNLMAVGAFGLGAANDLRDLDVSTPDKLTASGFRCGMMRGTQVGTSRHFVHALILASYIDNTATNAEPAILLISGGNILLRSPAIGGASWYRTITFLSDDNTTVDSNGFVKRASPIAKLYNDKIELNEEAAEQEITFEKVAIGHYLVKGSTGFAQQGWYIETPKDANGNILFAVLYEHLENGDIKVKTYKKKFDIEQAAIVADLDKPIDITQNRWIDIRLQELPQKEISITPPSFQPTNLSQAVAAAMGNSDGIEQ